MTSSNTNLGLYDDLFAYRFALLDIYSNETDIIKKLKYRLIEIGIDYNEINELLYNFYNYFNISITYEEIQGAQIFLMMFRDSQINANTNTNLNILTNLLNLYLRNIQIEGEDTEEKEILTEEEIDKLPTTIIKEELDDNCSICFDKIELETEIYQIICNHKFHKNCLKPHLLNYNNRCPVCRTDIKPDE